MITSERARRNRLFLVVGSTALLVVLLVVAKGALFPFILSGVLAYLLYPVVRAMESVMPWRERWPGPNRVGAILVIYVLAIAVVAGALAIIVPPTFRQTQDFINDVPSLFARARVTIESWSDAYTDRVPEDLRAQIESTLESSGFILISAAKTVIARTVGAFSSTLTAIIGLAVVPFMVFYLLKDREAAVDGFYSLLPESGRRHTRNVVAITNGVLGAYVRAQLALGAVVGIVVFAGLFALGVKFSALLGLIAGVTELVPVIGPLLGAIPGVLVTLATSPGDLAWVILLYVSVQLVENTVLVPRIHGKAVDIHPAIIMGLLVVASEWAGLWGVLVVVPLAAVARDIFKYFHREWSEYASSAETEPPQEQTPAEQAP